MPKTDTTLPSMSSCRSVHLEDLRTGDYVTVLQRTFSIGTYAWCGLDTHQYPPETPIEMTFSEDFSLLQVQEICLPFVLCVATNKSAQVVDSRSVQLARVPKAFATKYLTAIKEEKRIAEGAKKKRKKSKRKRKRKKK